MWKFPFQEIFGISPFKREIDVNSCVLKNQVPLSQKKTLGLHYKKTECLMLFGVVVHISSFRELHGTHKHAQRAK
jgi:hypothetical protein